MAGGAYPAGPGEDGHKPRGGPEQLQRLHEAAMVLQVKYRTAAWLASSGCGEWDANIGWGG